MQPFTFVVKFRFDTTEYYETSFNITLSDIEIAYVKDFLKENGDVPFWAFEFENERLFNRMMQEHIAAILKCVNQNFVDSNEEPYTEETLGWDHIIPEFYWPDELLKP